MRHRGRPVASAPAPLAIPSDLGVAEGGCRPWRRHRKTIVTTQLAR